MFVVVSVCWLNKLGCAVLCTFAVAHSAMFATSAMQRKVLLTIRQCVLASVHSDLSFRHVKQTVYNY